LHISMQYLWTLQNISLHTEGIHLTLVMHSSKSLCLKLKMFEALSKHFSLQITMVQRMLLQQRNFIIFNNILFICLMCISL
jgi:hypothetical protein